MAGRRGKRRRKLLDDLNERTGYSHLKEETLDRTMWRARFGRGFGPVVRQTAKWMNGWILSLCLHPQLSSMQCACSVLYCHLCSVCLHHVFPHYLMKGTIFGQKSYWTQNVFRFSLQILSQTFLILRRTERDMIKTVYRSACKVPVTVVRF